MPAERVKRAQERRDTTATQMKRPPNAYLIFQNAVGRDVRRELGSDVRNWTKVVGEIWRGLPESERAPFREEAAKILESHKARCPDYKYKRKSKSSKQASKSSTVRNSHNADAGQRSEIQVVIYHPDSKEHGRRTPQAGIFAYHELKWEPIQEGRIQGPVTRRYERPPAVPIQMYSVCSSNANQESAESLDNMQHHANSNTYSPDVSGNTVADALAPGNSRTDDIHDPSRSPTSFDYPPSPPFHPLTASSPSSVELSEKTLSVWSTPSSTFLPMPSPSVFEPSLSQAPTSWMPQAWNRSQSALGIDLGFAHEELITSYPSISQSSLRCPPNLSPRDVADDFMSFIPPFTPLYWTAPIPSSFSTLQFSLPPADSGQGENSLLLDTGGRLSIQTETNSGEFFQGDGSLPNYAAEVDEPGTDFVTLAELIGTDSLFPS